MKIDLHTHSTFSDGTLTPEALVKTAADYGITHLALCDHDSTGGLLLAEEKAKEFSMTLIPAVEINTRQTDPVVHILGYFIDFSDEGFQKILQHHRELRIVRLQMMLERLRKMGIKIFVEDFLDKENKAAIGRPHVADKLKEHGIVFSRQEAFERFLAKGKPAYVPYEGPTPEEAIQIILDFKGIPVLAHPGYSVSEQVIRDFVGKGLQGVEVYYPSHSPSLRGQLLKIAQELNLVVTGGSDYHGPDSGHEGLGEQDIPQEVFERLLERKNKQ